MKCETDHCIYNKNWECLCDAIEINGIGMCSGYMIVTLESDFLEAQKEKQLKEFDDYWKEIDSH